MIFDWLPPENGAPLIDLAGGPTQIFQGPVPDVSSKFKGSGAQILVPPNDAKYWSSEYARKIEKLSERVTVMAFNRGDYPVEILGRNIVSIQNSIGRNRNKFTIIVPYNIQKLNFIELKTNPSLSISFVGFVPKSSLARIFHNLPNSLLHPVRSSGSLVRKLGLYNIKKSGLVYHVTERHHYGGAASLISDPKIFREQYIDSFAYSPYVFTPRGDANSSQRFFESLSVGRIPVVPNTGMLVPAIINSSSSLNYVSVSTGSKDIFQKVTNHWNEICQRSLDSSLIENRKFFESNWDYGFFMQFLFDQKDPDSLYKLSFLNTYI